MFVRLATKLIVISFTLVCSVANASTPRTALVIGNSNYKSAPLENPVNDARDMASALRVLEFDVIEQLNVNRQQIRQAVREFGEKLKEKGGIGFFYYAGHGMQVNGTNYLLPVDLRADSEEDVTDEAIGADTVLRAMEEANNSVNIVVLDACRNNPFANKFRSATRGLTRMNGPTGSIIAYATSPGSVAEDGNARNGLYTNYLLQEIMQPGLPIEQIFKRVRIAVEQQSKGKQIPWESSSLKGDFYFIEKVVVNDVAMTEEQALWEQLKQSDVVQDFEEFIAAYPISLFVPAAKLRIAQLTRPKQLPVTASNGDFSDAIKPYLQNAYQLMVTKEFSLNDADKIFDLLYQAELIAPNNVEVINLKRDIVNAYVQIASNGIKNETNESSLTQAFQVYHKLEVFAPYSREVFSLKADVLAKCVEFIGLQIDNLNFAVSRALIEKAFEIDANNKNLKLLAEKADTEEKLLKVTSRVIPVL